MESFHWPHCINLAGTRVIHQRSYITEKKSMYNIMCLIRLYFRIGRKQTTHPYEWNSLICGHALSVLVLNFFSCSSKLSLQHYCNIYECSLTDCSWKYNSKKIAFSQKILKSQDFHIFWSFYCYFYRYFLMPIIIKASCFEG